MGVIEKVSARAVSLRAPSVLVPGELPLDRILMGDCIATQADETVWIFMEAP